MNTIAEIFPAQWVEVLGWTLLHSLWQSFLVFVAVVTLLYCIHSRQSIVRYWVATGGLMFIAVLSIGTLIHLGAAMSMQAVEPIVGYHTTTITVGRVAQESFSGLLHDVNVLVEQHIPLIVWIWSIGAALFSLRLVSGWWYVQRIRRNTIEIDDVWSSRVQLLASSLDIRRFIPLGESSLIQAPIVIGALRPMILFPLGMCTGLSVEQLESIILHELIHIRRGDYLVNIAQSFLEAIYFFNPFVWVISGIIRREREYCCDDAVVRSNGNPLVYVRALTTLEEARLSKSGLALSFAESRNQLLHRIKRLMEKSGRNYSGRERIIPVALLVVGMVCASWLTIRSAEPAEQEIDLTAIPVAYDTSIKRSSYGYIKRTESGNDQDHQVEIITDLELSEDINPEVDLPPIPAAVDLDLAVPLILIADFPDLNLDVNVLTMDIAPEPNLFFRHQFRLDGIPAGKPYSGNDWFRFAREFQKNFANKFHCGPTENEMIAAGEVARSHQKEPEVMMEEQEGKIEHEFDEAWVHRMEELAADQERSARDHVDKFEIEKEVMEKNERLLQKVENDVRRWEEESDGRFREMEEQLEHTEEKFRMYQDRLRQELIKDGYVDRGEKIERIEITEVHIRINGADIKPADQKKYRKLFDQSTDDIKSRPKGLPGKME